MSNTLYQGISSDVIPLLYASVSAVHARHVSGAHAVLQVSGTTQIEPGGRTTVCSEKHSVTELVHDQALMGLCNPHLHWASCVLDGGDGRSACASIVSRNLHNIFPHQNKIFVMLATV